MTATKTEAKRPSHVIWQVVGQGEDARWIRVGAGWANKDGKGMNLAFDAYPVVGRTVIREVSEQDGQQPKPQKRGE